MSEINKQEGWEEEWDQLRRDCFFDPTDNGERMKFFIRSQRQQARQEVLEELIKVLPKDYYIQDGSSFRKVSFAEPRSEILKIINKLNIG